MIRRFSLARYVVVNHAEIEALLIPIIQGMSFEWVGAQWGHQGRGQSLCVFLDKEGGITLDDLSKVSRQVQAELAVAGVDMGACQLEVSSPGLDRPLFTREDFERYIGKRVKIELRMPVDGRRRGTGVIKSVIAEIITLDIDGQDFAFEHKQVSKAKLAPVLFDR
jgi:ribosome maturation factor RimP